MPKAGTYEYPSRDLDFCVDTIKTAHDNLNTLTFTRETFAEALHSSAKSGSFGMTVGAISMYGLADVGGGNIRVNDLGQLTFAGETHEKGEAMNRAVRNVKLFGDLYDRFGVNVTDDKIRLFLRERANVPPTEANSLALEIGKLLKKNMPYLTTAKAGGERRIEPASAGGRTVIESGSWELLTDSYGALRITDDISADFAVKAIQKFKERFQTQRQPPASRGAGHVDERDAKTLVESLPETEK